jgi:hypothetical protein
VASITIRQLNPETKRHLADQAARKGRSLEAEVRDILDSAALRDASIDDQLPFSLWMRQLLGEGGAPELALMLDQLDEARQQDRLLPDFGLAVDA